MSNNRRYDIDWLRIIAIGLLLIYHISIGFQPWGALFGFIKNDESMTWIWTPMSMLNIWRIPLLFLVSGMGVYFAIQRRNWKALIIERSKRILVPYVFGVLAIAPLHVFLWQNYFNQEITYLFSPGHLWFLGYIFLYVMVLSPVFFYLKKHQDGRFQQFLKKLMSSPAGLLIVLIPFVAEAELVQPEAFEVYAIGLHGFLIGMIAFFTGFCCVYSGKVFWNTITKWRWLLLAIAATLYTFRIWDGDFQSQYFLMAIESNLWIFTVFGFGHRYLNKPSKVLTYLSQAAYPVYILHMAFQYLGSWLLFPMEITAMFKFILIIAFTMTGSFATYELIRRINFLRPLFGLKIIQKQGHMVVPIDSSVKVQQTI